MASIRKRRREIAQLAAGPAKAWPWVRINRYGSRRMVGQEEISVIQNFRFITSENPAWSLVAES